MTNVTAKERFVLRADSKFCNKFAHLARKRFQFDGSHVVLLSTSTAQETIFLMNRQEWFDDHTVFPYAQISSFLGGFHVSSFDAAFFFGDSCFG